MDRAQIESLLKEVSEGRTQVVDALEKLRDLPFEDMGFAKLDHHRALRTGMPEVIFAAGKTTEMFSLPVPHAKTTMPCSPWNRVRSSTPWPAALP